MNQKGIIKYKNGKIGIVTPAPNALKQGLTLEAIVERQLTDGDTYIIVTDDQIPTNRYFRDSWKLEGEKIKVDKESAIAHKMARLRAVRNKELIDQDVKFTKANEAVSATRFQIEELDETISNLQNELLVPDLDPLRKSDIQTDLQTHSRTKHSLQAVLKKDRRICKDIAVQKQKLRDLPATMKLDKLRVTQLQHYVPPELAHRTDVD